MIDKNTQALKQAEMNPQEEKQALEQAPIEKVIYVKLPTGGYKPFMYEDTPEGTKYILSQLLHDYHLEDLLSSQADYSDQDILELLNPEVIK